MLSHKEWEPAVEQLADRFRVVLPDLPLHGDSEDRPRHPYTLDWFAEVMSGFSAEVLGPASAARRPRRGRGDPAARGRAPAACAPSRLVLMGNRLHAPPQRARTARTPGAWPPRAGAVPGLDRLLTHGARAAFTPERGLRLSARGNPAARDLVRHAFADVPGNPSLARSWAAARGHWPRGAQTQLLELYPRLDMPVLLLWADRDRLHPLAAAEEALALLPNGQLRVLQSTGFLMAYDDPVGLARELAAFCG